MDFAESAEHRALRAAVSDIAAKFGPRYYAERAAARRPCTELWQALGDAGFIGVNIPDAYGGGGGGMTELALVCEEIAAAEAALAAIDAAIQTHGGNGLASEYGLMPYWGLARLLRIAPVNREMILNYVAQHSLGLPRSY